MADNLDLSQSLDPRILLASTLIGLGLATADKIKALWSQHGEDDDTLKLIITEAEQRIQRRS